MWDELNCMVVWAFFVIAFLCDWDENWPFPVLWALLFFQICWQAECSTITASSFRNWNSSAGIPSPPLALFLVMLCKAHLTSHHQMSGSRLVTPQRLNQNYLLVSECLCRGIGWQGLTTWTEKLEIVVLEGSPGLKPSWSSPLTLQ